jgi:hypothetical protein
MLCERSLQPVRTGARLVRGNDVTYVTRRCNLADRASGRGARCSRQVEPDFAAVTRPNCKSDMNFATVVESAASKRARTVASACREITCAMADSLRGRA